jgi:hypothetical protein
MSRSISMAPMAGSVDSSGGAGLDLQPVWITAAPITSQRIAVTGKFISKAPEVRNKWVEAAAPADSTQPGVGRRGASGGFFVAARAPRQKGLAFGMDVGISFPIPRRTRNGDDETGGSFEIAAGASDG